AQAGARAPMGLVECPVDGDAENDTGSEDEPEAFGDRAPSEQKRRAAERGHERYHRTGERRHRERTPARRQTRSDAQGDEEPELTEPTSERDLRKQKTRGMASAGEERLESNAGDDGQRHYPRGQRRTHDDLLRARLA